MSQNVWAIIMPFGPVTIPRLMPTVTNSCDEEE